MYVRWKSLLTFGTIFWITICLYDVYFIDPVLKAYCSDSDEYAWLATVSEEEDLTFDAFGPRNYEDASDEKYSFGKCLLFWNTFVFLVTLVFCIGGKLARNYFRPEKTNTLIRTEVSKKTSGSKIPVLHPPPKSTVNISENDDAASSRASTNMSSTSVKDDLTSKYMEKQCSRLRDEMISIQATSLKEHSLITKKLETAVQEKKELFKKLGVISKENRTARQQVEQLLSEKCILLERLECASKEFRQNTKSRKAALAKLEESQAHVAILMKEVEKYRNERDELEKKFKNLDSENQLLKDRVDQFENNQQKLQPNAKKNEDDLSQSHRDVQKVQQRLMDLEKSLDKFKHNNNWKKPELKKANPTVDSDVSQQTETDHTIQTNSENPLEVSYAATKLLTDNLTDEQRQIILKPVNYIRELPKTERPDLSTKDACEQVGKNTENIEDEDTDECDASSRIIIRESPAFQSFLYKMDKIDKLQEKFAIPTNMF